MARKLGLIEGFLIFAAVCAALYLFSSRVLVAWDQRWFLVARAAGFSLCCMIIFYTNDLYDLRAVQSPAHLRRRLIRSFGILTLLLAGFVFLFPQNRFGALPLASSLLMVAGVVLCFRAVSHRLMNRRPFVKNTVILGTSPLARKIIHKMETQPHFGYSIIAIVDDAGATPGPVFPYPLLEVLQQLGYPFLGPLKNLAKLIEELSPDCIIVALPETLERRIVRDALLESRTRGIVIEDVAEVYERLTERLAIEWLTPKNLIFSYGFCRSWLDQALARGLSILFAVVGLTLSAPLFGLLALVIKLDSRGSVFFVQDRAGLYGRPFRLIKFRTMHPAHGKTSEWVRDNGERITRVGKWLRKFRLDELPQFINVLKGNMNLVGPRPHPLSNYDLFVLVSRNAPECGEPIPYYALRSMVRPGITGWAQIRYRYANGLEEEMEKMQYDLYYIKHMSFWFDLRILFETLRIVLFGREFRAGEGERMGEREIRTTEGLQKAA